MLCGKNVEFVTVKPGGTYSNHWDLRGYFSTQHFSVDLGKPSGSHQQRKLSTKLGDRILMLLLLLSPAPLTFVGNS